MDDGFPGLIRKRLSRSHSSLARRSNPRAAYGNVFAGYFDKKVVKPYMNRVKEVKKAREKSRAETDALFPGNKLG